MTRVSPLRKLHQQAEASFKSLGPAPGPSGAPGAAVEVVDTFGDREGEYNAIRRAAALVDLPQRATVRVAGADRLDFLNRMLTQELKGVRPFQARRSFWLNRKGRVDADLRVIELEGRTLFDVDISAGARAIETLGAFLVAEDVQLADETEQRHRLAIHGPAALAALRAVATPVAGPPLADLTPGGAGVVSIAGREVIVDRQDSTGEIGLELLLDAQYVNEVYQQFLERCAEHDGDSDPSGPPCVRPIGVRALEIARLEAGWPVFPTDFGPDNLPAETGVIDDRVSFTKGCYLGQEVVARMKSLGHPKQRLVALRFADPAAGPAVGDKLRPADAPDADAVGHVTSAAPSPALGGRVVAFAQVKWSHVTPGARLVAATARGPGACVVADGLRSLPARS